MDPAIKVELCKTLIYEIKLCYSLDIDSDVAMQQRGITPQSEPAAAVTIVIIGASNGARLVNILEAAGIITHLVRVPSWKPKSSDVVQALEDLAKLELPCPEKTLIVFYNLDCAAYYGLTEDGDLVPAQRHEGKYHINGALIIAPKEQFQFTLKTCLPLLKFRPDVKKIVLSPAPRYWMQKCCEDKEHISNFNNEDYEAKMFEGLDNLRRCSKDFLFMQRVCNIKVCNPFQVFGCSSGRTVCSLTISAVCDIWGEHPINPDIDCSD
jgi:hypothetical protein